MIWIEMAVIITSFNWSSRDRRRVIQRTGPLPKL